MLISFVISYSVEFWRYPLRIIVSNDVFFFLACPPKCVEDLIGDGVCDKACDIEECNFVDIDCNVLVKRNVLFLFIE